MIKKRDFYPILAIAASKTFLTTAHDIFLLLLFVKAWAMEQRGITSVVPCLPSLLHETLKFFCHLVTLVILPAKKKLFWHLPQCLVHNRHTVNIF